MTVQIAAAPPMHEATTTSEMIVFLVILAVRSFCAAAWDCWTSGATLVTTVMDWLWVAGLGAVVVAMLRVGAGAVVEAAAAWLVLGAAELVRTLLLVGTEEVEGVEEVEETVVDDWVPPKMPVRLSRRSLRVVDATL
jgi:hypothetical protein